MKIFIKIKYLHVCSFFDNTIDIVSIPDLCPLLAFNDLNVFMPGPEQNGTSQKQMT